MTATRLQNYEMFRFNDRVFHYVAKGPDNEIIDLTGATIVWGIAREYGLPPRLSKSSALGQITTASPSSGAFDVHVDRIDTLGHSWFGDYDVTVSITDAGGDILTIMHGRLRIRPLKERFVPIGECNFAEPPPGGGSETGDGNGAACIPSLAQAGDGNDRFWVAGQYDDTFGTNFFTAFTEHWVHPDAGAGRVWKRVSAGTQPNPLRWHYMAIDDLGELYTWGANDYAQLGHGDTVDRSDPVKVAGVSNVVFVHAGKGAGRMFFIRADGTMWGCGQNLFGRLAVGDLVDRTTFTQEAHEHTNWLRVLTSDHTGTWALKCDGSMWNCGPDPTVGKQGYGGAFREGQHTLGGAPAVSYAPKSVNKFAPVTPEAWWIEFDADWETTEVCILEAIDAEGRSWECGIWGGIPVFGSAPYYESGIDSDLTRIDYEVGYDRVRVGESAKYLRWSDGKWYASGREYRGEFGDGAPALEDFDALTAISAASEFDDIEPGVESLFVFKASDDKVYVAGGNDDHQIGLASEGADQTTFVAPPGLPAFASGAVMAPSYLSSVILPNANRYTFNPPTPTTKTYKLRGWGANDRGQLALGHVLEQSSPAAVGNAPYRHKISAGQEHIALIRQDGTLWAAGRNVEGQLGLGDNDDRYMLTQVGVDTDWEFVACGGYHTLAIKKSGALYAFGKNGRGQLGVGDTSDRNTPTLVATGGSNNRWWRVAAGLEHSIGIDEITQLWAWGDNTYSQLGQGAAAPTSFNAPVQCTMSGYTPANAGWHHAACGHRHSIAANWATGDGRVRYCGDNTFNQLGRPGLTQVDTWANFWLTGPNFRNNCTEVYAGAFSSYILSRARQIAAAGFNENGELGMGHSDPVTSFALIPGLDGANTNGNVAIANRFPFRLSCGDYHVIAADDWGETISWGRNERGQLGLGDTVNRDEPTLVSAIPQWTQYQPPTLHFPVAGGASSYLVSPTEG